MGNKHGREEKGKYRNNNTCPKEPARYDTSWIETIERSYVVVWCDPTIGAPSTANDDKNTLLQLARVLNKKRQLIHTFNEMEPCREFIKNANNICLIVSGQMGTELVPSVHDLYQIDSVFIFCLNKPKYDAWAKQYKKIRGVFTDIKEICEYLKTYFKSQMPADYEQLQFDLITKDLTLPGTNKIDIAFLYPMFSKIILSNLQTVQYEDMINYFRMEFTSEYQTQLINDIENTYSQHNPIWWFTRDRFFQGIINRALQIHDLHTLCLMIPYLKDLENALTDLHKQQIHSSPKTLQLYLSQTISRDDFEKFRLNIGGLICINQFLFANTQRAIALLFVDEELSTPNNARNINVVFEISISKTIDPNTNYANIGPISDFVHEKEYLLSMSSIYRVDKIDEYMKTPLVWSIHLTLIDKNDSLLSNFTRIINAEYLSKEIDLSELSSNIKTKLDLFPSTRKLFEHGLNFHTKQIRPILLHYNMGIIYDALNDYEKALNQYEYAIKSTRTSELHVQQRDNLCLVPFYANLALTYQQSNRRKEAFEHGFRTLEILNKDGTNSIFRNELTASSHYNLGLILDLQGEPDQAKPHYELALKYRQEYLPNNHPDVISLQQTISSASSQQGENDD